MKTAIIGAQWGDEGKGKIINFFASHHNYDYIVRFAGGANAGHTIYYNGKKYVHHLLPSIPYDKNTKGVLGANMVIDIESLLAELKSLEQDFPKIGQKLIIDKNATLVLPPHKGEDYYLDNLRKQPIGTTGKGIGPAYSDKIMRNAIKMEWILQEDFLKEKLNDLCDFKNKLYQSKNKWDEKVLWQDIVTCKRQLVDLGVQFLSTSRINALLAGSSVLFEGAQGMLLDIDMGTYPFVTSSNCGFYSDYRTTSPIHTFGVFKAYATRVGNGPFPTEDNSNAGEQIREMGHEYGATTGRPRRVGWLDLVALKYVIKKCEISSLIITKSDILTNVPRIKICLSYEINGQQVSEIDSPTDFLIAKPIYQEVKGWKSLSDDSFAQYIQLIEQTVQTPISHISTGPLSNDMMKK